MRLDGSALLAREVLQTAAGRIERFTDCDSGVAVEALDLGLFVGGLPLDVRTSVMHPLRQSAGGSRFANQVGKVRRGKIRAPMRTLPQTEFPSGSLFDRCGPR